MGNSRGAATRKWNREMDKSKYLLLIGAKPQPEVVGLGVLADGRRVSVSPGRKGKVSVMLHEPLRFRTFGLMQIDEMKEWVDSKGVLAKEQNRKALNAAAPILLEALENALPFLASFTWGNSTNNAYTIAKDAIARARGKS